jgi:predicted MPP superfamily phosphohydrolase
VLVNEAVPLEPTRTDGPSESSESTDPDGPRLWLAGTGDPAGRGWSGGGARAAAPDVERTLAAVPPDEPVLAIAHNPALWPALAARGVDLTLSGHTHYGQLAIPRLGWSMASPFLKLAMGTHRRGRSLLYIHPGTNYWGIPFRLGTPPEVAVLTLRAARGDEPELRPCG